ncbi:MAG: fluoride efflux transporter CrcB [Balneolaceae bacterium]
MNIDLFKVLAVGAGGFLGAAGRYILYVFAQSQFQDSSFPYGTVLVNLLGCLLIGLLAGLFEAKSWISPEVRLFIFVGILGGFTTFSTFAHESFLLWKHGELLIGLLNISLQVIFGLLFVWLGYMLIRIFQ